MVRPLTTRALRNIVWLVKLVVVNQPRESFLSRETVILSACRTPVGRFLGALSDVPAVKLGGIAIAEAVKRAGLEPAEVDEVIVGNVLQAGQGQNPGRLALHAAGLPDEVPAVTVNKLCGSSMKALHFATQAVTCGDAEVVVAAGMENMSLAPYLLAKARTGYRMGDGLLEDHLLRDGLMCAVNDYHMGMTAENVAERYGVTREDQDAFALESQRRAGGGDCGRDVQGRDRGRSPSPRRRAR